MASTNKAKPESRLRASLLNVNHPLSPPPLSVALKEISIYYSEIKVITVNDVVSDDIVP